MTFTSTPFFSLLPPPLGLGFFFPMALNTAAALKPHILKALKGASSLLTPKAHLELQQEVLQDVSIELRLTQAPFTEPLLPHLPLTPESINDDVALHLATELHQVPFFFFFRIQSLYSTDYATRVAN